MIKTICPQYIGAKEDFYQAAPLIAQQGYFQGYYSFEPEADTAQGACKTAALLQEYGLQPVGFRVPVDISRKSIFLPRWSNLRPRFTQRPPVATAER